MMYIIAEIMLSAAACYGVTKFFFWLQKERDRIEGVEYEQA